MLANKQDKDNALEKSEIEVQFSLEEISDRSWTIVECSAKTADGIESGIDYVSHIRTIAA